LYFQDESGFSLIPCVPYGWQYRGQTKFLSSEISQRLNVMGFLSTNHAFKSVIFRGSINADCFIQTIEQLFATVEKETWIVVDNSPTHTSHSVKQKIKIWAKRKLHLFFLPAYSPHLNPIEILWRFIKYYWMPLNAYQSFQHLAEALEFILKNIGTSYLINFA
jgi:transposase